MNRIKNSIIKVILFFSFIFLPNFLISETISSTNMNVIKDYFDRMNTESLAVFDIDNTLIVPENPAFQIPNVKKRKSLLKDIVPKWTEDEFGISLSLIGLEGMGILLDLDTPQLIQDLQRKGAKCIALTALNTGYYKNYIDLFSHRANQLKNCGIDFSTSSPHTVHKVFKHLKPEIGTYPESRDGIILSNGSSNEKAEVLLAYLEEAQWIPEFILFVDDKKSHVENMSSVLDKKGIKNICILFNKIETFEALDIDDKDFLKEWQDLEKCAKDALESRKTTN